MAALLHREACDGLAAFPLLFVVGDGEGCPASLEQGTLAVMIRLKDDAARLNFAALVGPAWKSMGTSATILSARCGKVTVSGCPDQYSQTPLAAENVHLVLLSSRLTALLSIAGVSGPPFASKSLKKMPCVSVSKTHSAPTCFQKSPAGICWAPVGRLVELVNVAVPDRPLPPHASVGIGGSVIWA